jgi:hypothetical protein
VRYDYQAGANFTDGAAEIRPAARPQFGDLNLYSAYWGCSDHLHTGGNMFKSHTHTKDCPDRKAAATERAQHEAASKKREVVRQALAQAEWFDWYKK